MLKLFKYLKGSTLALIAIVCLLVGQAACDLALPEYTSRIVDIGINQSGIESSAPEIIRKSQLEKLFLFMSNNEDKNTVLDNYSLIGKDNLSQSEFENYKSKYPLIESEDLYKINELQSKEIKNLEEIMAKPILLLSGFETESEEMQAVKKNMLAGFEKNIPGGVGSIASQSEKLSENDLIFKMMKSMPDNARAEMLKEMNQQFVSMPKMIVDKSAIMAIKSEYKIIGVNTDNTQNLYLLKIGGIMLFISFLGMAATIIVGFLGSRIAARLGMTLRSSVFKKVLSFSNTEFDKFSTASLITRSTNDIQQVQMFMVMLLRIVFYAPIIGLGGIFKVLSTNNSMTWIIGLAVLTIISIVMLLFAIVMPKFKMVQKLIDKLNLVTREILEGIPVIRAFSTQKHEEKRFDKANRDLTKVNLFVNRIMSIMMPAMMFVMNAIIILIMYIGASNIDSGNMQVGDLFAFIQYTMQIIMSFLMISMFSIMLPRASVSAKRIDEIITTDVSIKDKEISVSFDERKKGLIEFKNVSFRYPSAEEDVLKNITFNAKPGQTTAFIGSTGSGKSTLINLIPRFYDITEGEILIDGVSIKDMTQKQLRKKMGYVPQKGVLFSGTIESNIKYSDEKASDELMNKAAEVAQASDFINEKSERYSSPISQGGTNVSGGQKQRLSIARAIMNKPEIYIFDDSFSALDYKTDVTLRKALKEYTSESTVLIVAQRINTIIHAEQIVVLDEGEIAGIGTHKELLKTCDVYKQIALSQLSKEELENNE